MSILSGISIWCAMSFWWLCCQRWMGGGPQHPSYSYALCEYSTHRLLLRAWIEEWWT